MMLKTKIKASAVTNLTDARYFAARDIEWLGFRLAGDPALVIPLVSAKAVAEWVDGVTIVGEFDFATAAEIEEARRFLPFEVVQVGMYTPVGELEKLTDMAIIKEIIVEDAAKTDEVASHVAAYEGLCDYFLFDFTKAGIDWMALKAQGPTVLSFWQGLFRRAMAILAIDCKPGEVRELLSALEPTGLNLMGGREEKVGIKSFDELDELLDQFEPANEGSQD